MGRFGLRAAEAAIGRIEAARSLDAPGYAIGNAVAQPMQVAGRPSQTIRNVLHGTWYGHPVHPMLITIPIGTWTLALGLDFIAMLGASRDGAAARTANVALKAGAAGAVASAVAGLSDWMYTDGRDRRLGLVHGLVNSTALGLHLASISLRQRDRLAEGRLVSAVGWACMFVGGYLGGHLVYRRRIGIDHADRSREPRDFKPVLPTDELIEDQPRRIEVRDEVARRDVAVVLVRHDGRINALGARCSHLRGPLDRGWVLNGALVCPWHGSRYDLETGMPTAGPSNLRATTV